LCVSQLGEGTTADQLSDYFADLGVQSVEIRGTSGYYSALICFNTSRGLQLALMHEGCLLNGHPLKLSKHQGVDDFQLVDLHDVVTLAFHILFENYHLLSISELHPFFLVCRRWYNALKQESFSWALFEETTFVSPATLNFSLNSPAYAFQPAGEKAWILCDYQGQAICSALPEKPLLCKDTRVYSDRSLFDVQFQLLSLKKSFHLKVHQNRSRVLRALIDTETECPARPCIWQAVDSMVERDITRAKFSALKILSLQVSQKPVAALIPQPPGFLEITMFPHQLKAFDWMLSWERNVVNGSHPVMDYSPYVDIYYGRNQVILDLPAREIVSFTENGQEHERISGTKTWQATAKGAILSDEIGLGKTVELISLILGNPTSPDTFRIIDPGIQFYQPKATLICCPEHLVEQWRNEVKRLTNLKVTSCVSEQEHALISYRDVIESDVVIVSFQFLKDPKYYRHRSTRRGRIDLKDVRARRKDAKTQVEQQKRKQGHGETVKQPLLDHFAWHRYVIQVLYHRLILVEILFS